MSWIKTIARETFGLFVDDGRFALAILAWLALIHFGLPWFPLLVGWGGLALVGGLGAILVESVVRRASRRN